MLTLCRNIVFSLQINITKHMSSPWNGMVYCPLYNVLNTPFQYQGHAMLNKHSDVDVIVYRRIGKHFFIDAAFITCDNQDLKWSELVDYAYRAHLAVMAYHQERRQEWSRSVMLSQDDISLNIRNVGRNGMKPGLMGWHSKGKWNEQFKGTGRRRGYVLDVNVEAE